jgi:hypothetical protein
MAIRFRKSIKVAPGLKLNISKSGVSASVGRNGLTANLSKRGTRTTVGIPGTGLSASKLHKAQPSSEQASISGKTVLVVCVVVVAIVWFIFG